MYEFVLLKIIVLCLIKIRNECNDETLLNHDDYLSLTEMLPLDPMDLFPTPYDVTTLSKQVEQLNIEVNTQNLKVEIEKLNRQKLGTTLKRIKKETIPIQRVLAQIRNDNHV